MILWLCIAPAESQDLCSSLPEGNVDVAMVKAVLEFEVFFIIENMWTAKLDWSFFSKTAGCDLSPQHSLCNCPWGKSACVMYLSHKHSLQGHWEPPLKSHSQQGPEDISYLCEKHFSGIFCLFILF